MTKERAIYYGRDSEGRHENTPASYIAWAQETAKKKNLRFNGTPDQIERMLQEGVSVEGDIYQDHGVTGNKLSRPALDQMIKDIESDPTIKAVITPRRDRLARADNPLDAMTLENEILKHVELIITQNREIHQGEQGEMQDLGTTIQSFVEHYHSAQEVRNLSKKVLYAQQRLASKGYSTGGRPPYGFSRYLYNESTDEIVRRLEDGERVKMAGHHVILCPDPDQSDELKVIDRIYRDIQTKPASQIARNLTREGVPTPDAGRLRTDNGVTHETSGIWNDTTVVSIARNPIYKGVNTYARRQMGRLYRHSKDGPRVLTPAEKASENTKEAKVVMNPQESWVYAPGRFDPIIDADTWDRVQQILDQRGGSQRHKPRSRHDDQNPFGGRITCMNCAWPLYRSSKGSSFGYRCGKYMQRDGQECDQNYVDGILLARHVLSQIRKNVFTTAVIQKTLSRIREKLSERQGRDLHKKTARQTRHRENRRKELEKTLEKVGRNMARADNEPQLNAMKQEYERIKKELDHLASIEAPTPAPEINVDEVLEACQQHLNNLEELADDPDNIPALGDLFRALNVDVFLRFKKAKWGKRSINVVANGVVTIGDAPPPIEKYRGPTGKKGGRTRRRGRGDRTRQRGGKKNPPPKPLEADSLGNTGRGGRI